VHSLDCSWQGFIGGAFLGTDKVYRIGEKLVSLEKAFRHVERALELREQGVSQQEVSRRLSIDRSLISRIESIGEIRKGTRVAVIGFPLSNKEEIATICSEQGLDFYLLLNNNERWEMVSDKQALDFFNEIFDLVARLKQFDTLIMVTSEKWYHLAEALFNIQVVHLTLGQTPIEEDRRVDPVQFRKMLEQVLSKQ